MVKKHLVITVLLLVITVAVTKFDITIAPELLSTLFTVNGIMFSIGLGLIASFNMSGIKNKAYITSIRSNIKKVRNLFMLLFSFSACSFIISLLAKQPIMMTVRTFDLALNLSVFSVLVIIYTTIYFIINFLAIQKLNDDIFDRLIDEK